MLLHTSNGGLAAGFGREISNNFRFLDIDSNYFVSLLLKASSCSFLKDGIPALLSWDYSFFHNSWGGIVRLILCSTLSAGLVWAFFSLMVPVVGSVVANVFGGVFRR